VTCHDGFTLNDLVSYNEKHNEANGQENRDGADDNHSWNFGVEGPTGDPAIESARNRQVKNFFTVTLLSLGVPMILMGDEVRRTQRGNNNAYCQDGEVSWFDWTLLDRHADVHRFVQLLCRRRLLRNVEPGCRPVPLNELVREAQIVWHGVTAGEPDWGPQSHSLAVSAAIDEPGVTFYLAANAYSEPLDFELPAAVSTTAPTGVSWRRWIDTARESPDDIVEWSAAPTIGDRRYRVAPRSVIVLMTP
jgi:glycogen operon protein